MSMKKQTQGSKKINLVYPFSALYPADASLLSLILTDQKSLGWILNAYCNINISKDYYLCDFTRKKKFSDCPFLECKVIDDREGILKNFSNFNEFIKHCTNNNYIIYLNVNTKYIAQYMKNDNICHNMMVYGYDEIKSLVNIADFFPNKGYKYTYDTCSINEINNAFYFYKDVVEEGKFDEITLLKYRSCDDYMFDKMIYIENLKKYLNGSNIYYEYYNEVEENVKIYFKNWETISCGLECYDTISEMLINNSHKWIIHPIQALLCHKLIIKNGLHYLQEYGHLQNHHQLFEYCSELCDDLIQIRNLYLKYFILKSKTNKNTETMQKLIQNIVNKLIVLKNKDSIFISTLISELEK